MIPFNKPFVPDISKKYAAEALESDHQQGDGPFTKKASQYLSKLVGGGHILLTPSCTHALEMASMLVDIGPGDEVILPSYTFTSAATAITKFGATPVFVDIDPITKGIDANQVAEAITSKTKAISWVNYAGVAPDIDALQSLSKQHELFLIEDNAHGLGGTYKGRPLGSFGDFATQSFHATKNIQCGEGGALVINNKKFIDRAEVIREKGTDRSKFLAGQIEKYQWVDKGSSYLLAEVLAAILCGQLENFNLIQSTRIDLERTYTKLLEKSSQKIFKINPLSMVGHLFYVELNDNRLQSELLFKLQKAGIQATFHYQPLHISAAGKQFRQSQTNTQESVKFAESILRLPMWFGLTEVNQIQIIDVLLKEME